ncbi:hypothetical protein H0H81_005424, partial [Sphagnurus paluster]
VLDDSLETLNNRWSKEHKLDLIRDEVEFRWSGNKVFLPNTANNTVGQVYMEYLTGDMAAFYTQPEAKGKRGSGPKNQLTMALELYVDKPAFMIRFKPVEKGAPPLHLSWARMSLEQSDMQSYPVTVGLV